VAEYNATAAVWMRGLLQHEYGVHPSDVRWYQGGLHDPGRKEKAMGKQMPGVSIEPVPEGRSLNDMLVAGELDALAVPRMPIAFVQGSSCVRRLFPNFRAVEQDYFRRTGIFPIMHSIVLRRDVYEANRWVAESLYKALVRAKEVCVADLYHAQALAYMLPWLLDEIEQTRSLMGDDYWAYGLEPNRRTLEAFTQYAEEQGLTPERIPIESLFAPPTIEEFKI
jgi:4,5-dihydroxyphthalate decarboxylase